MSRASTSQPCQPAPVRTQREDGVVLLLVLVIIVLTIGSVYAFARTTVLEAMSSRQRTARVRAEILARAGIHIAVRTLIDDLYLSDDLMTTGVESPKDPWRLLSRTPIEIPGNGTLRIRVDDAGSRISLNALVDEDGEPHSDSAGFLKAALERIIEEMPGREEDKLYEVGDLVDAILDWLDRDDETRLGDNEADYYRNQGSGALPIDRPVLTLDELSDVPEMDALLLETLKAYFTAHPMFPDIEHSGVNPNTAPAHILGLIYIGAALKKELLDRDEVFRILEARSEDKVFCPSEYGEECESFAALTGFTGDPFPPLQYVSHIFTVKTEARYDEARACVTAVISREVTDGPETLFYRMGC